MTMQHSTTEMPRRRATIMLDSWHACVTGCEPGIHEGYVLGAGPYQYINSPAEAYPVFVFELHNGRVVIDRADRVTFVDTNKEVSE